MLDWILVLNNPVNRIDPTGLRDYIMTYNTYSFNLLGFQLTWVDAWLAAEDKNEYDTYDAISLSGLTYGTAYSPDFFIFGHTRMNQEKMTDFIDEGEPNVKRAIGRIQMGGGTLAIGDLGFSGGYLRSGGLEGINKNTSRVQGMDISVGIMEGKIKPRGDVFSVADPYLKKR